MRWYTASVVTSIHLLDSARQDVIPVFEDFYLLTADTRAAAEVRAREIGESIAVLDEGLQLNGLPAKRRFIGVRKIRSIANPPDRDLDESAPVDGTELSHSYFEVEDEATLQKLATGKRARVDYVDDDED